MDLFPFKFTAKGVSAPMYALVAVVGLAVNLAFWVLLGGLVAFGAHVGWGL